MLADSSLLEEETAKVGELYQNSKDLTLNASQFADERPVTCVRYAPNDRYVATASLSPVVRMGVCEMGQCD
jgi:hypothetical protein